MAGTRTAPAFTAAATDRRITLLLIDDSGDKWAEGFRVPVAEPAADIEAAAAAYAAGSNASLYGILDMQMRTGNDAAGNASSGNKNGVENGINLLFNNVTTHINPGLRLVAPINDVFTTPASDIPDTTDAVLDALITAFLAVTPAGAFFDSAQYTTRRERKNNPRVE